MKINYQKLRSISKSNPSIYYRVVFFNKCVDRYQKLKEELQALTGMKTNILNCITRWKKKRCLESELTNIKRYIKQWLEKHKHYMFKKQPHARLNRV